MSGLAKSLAQGAVVALVALAAGVSLPASAAPVHGAITFAADAAPPSLEDEPRGYWRLDLGVTPLPRQPPFRESLVVLEPLLSTNKSAPAAVTVELRGLRMEPRVVALGVGGTVTFKNADRLPHTLRIDGSSPMAPAVTPARARRAHKSLARSASSRSRPTRSPICTGGWSAWPRLRSRFPTSAARGSSTCPRGAIGCGCSCTARGWGSAPSRWARAPLDLPLRLENLDGKAGSEIKDVKDNKAKKEEKKQ